MLLHFFYFSFQPEKRRASKRRAAPELSKNEKLNKLSDWRGEDEKKNISKMGRGEGELLIYDRRAEIIRKKIF